MAAFVILLKKSGAFGQKLFLFDVSLQRLNSLIKYNYGKRKCKS